MKDTFWKWDYITKNKILRLYRKPLKRNKNARLICHLVIHCNLSQIWKSYDPYTAEENCRCINCKNKGAKDAHPFESKKWKTGGYTRKVKVTILDSITTRDRTDIRISDNIKKKKKTSFFTVSFFFSARTKTLVLSKFNIIFLNISNWNVVYFISSLFLINALYFVIILVVVNTFLSPYFSRYRKLYTFSNTCSEYRILWNTLWSFHSDSTSETLPSNSIVCKIHLSI